MDLYIAHHLETWANREFKDDTERDDVIKMLTDLWSSDADYFASKSHSWWELYDMAKRNQALTLQNVSKRRR